MEPSLLESQRTIDTLKHEVDSLKQQIQSLHRKMESKDVFILNSIVKQRRASSPLATGSVVDLDHPLLYNKHMTKLQEWKPTTEILEEIARTDIANDTEADCVWSDILSQYIKHMATIRIQTERLDQVHSADNLQELITHQNTLSVKSIGYMTMCAVICSLRSTGTWG